MVLPRQGVSIVLEHISGISDYDEEGYEDAWCVVANLDLDGGKRQRVTLFCCPTRADACASLEDIWTQVTSLRSRKADAA